MEKQALPLVIFLGLFSFALIITGCSKKSENSEPKDIWDIDKKGIPKFVETNFIELSKVYRISKFRSSIGHDYSDFTEHCRSMKHYFEPQSNFDWTTVKIYSPINGIITRVEQEWTGTKIEIASDEYPAFRFSIFHINLTAARNVGDKILEGEQLGTHIGSQTLSDISVIVNDPTKKGRMVSFFEVITDALFTEFYNRGVSSRDVLIIPKTTRDINPLSCNGDTFITSDPLECWVILE